ncbi:hypothetical protein [Deinococcus roseus]|uniref:Uncharacterized protein n=1 Tax=Deinococcus roseus TaxID=392414 RepID=A0ABQ2DDE5_9DEIO|nr:hypothetical protein [Deinococcus roseus]GGJ53024.1 hypothetical protein GCM10008938_43750 [Deinococcus roseus]
MTDAQVIAVKSVVLRHLSSRTAKRPLTLFSEVSRELREEKRIPLHEDDVRAVVWMLVSEGALRVLPDRTLQKKRGACVKLE